MRRSSLVAVLMVVVLAVVLPAVPAVANHAPESSCSGSGDVCTSATRVNGVIMLRISTAANYFDRYTLCVTAPDASRVCKRFRMRPAAGGTYRGSVAWKRQFPMKGPGPYTVRWKLSGTALTPKLGFHVRG